LHPLTWDRQFRLRTKPYIVRPHAPAIGPATVRPALIEMLPLLMRALPENRPFLVK
jgi:hypothetical protein